MKRVEGLSEETAKFLEFEEVKLYRGEQGEGTIDTVLPKDITNTARYFILYIL